MTRREHAKRHLDVDLLQVVLGCALDPDVAGRLAPLARDLDHPRAGEVLPGERVTHRLDLCRRPLRDDVAAVLTGPGAHVDEVIGRAHRPLVVLDDEHGVTEVPEAFECRDQLLVVPLVQPDRRLVEDVEHPHERGADLRREPDALGLAAGQRRGGALHREVADADVLQELEPLLDLTEDEPRDPTIVIRQLKLSNPLERPTRRQSR